MARSDLHTRLVAAINERGKVHFQPPSNVMLEYPCIIYELSTIDIDHANNKPYAKRKQYQVMVIDTDCDSEIVDAVSRIPTCGFNRYYVLNGLYHTVFRIFE